jgi:hypothetical protein
MKKTAGGVEHDGKYKEERAEVERKAGVHSGPWIESSVKILGHNPFDFASADSFLSVPFSVLLVFANLIVGAVFVALMLAHRRSLSMYHKLLLIAIVLSVAHVLSNLSSAVHSNMYARDHLRPAMFVHEVVAIVVRIVLGGFIRLLFGLFCMGYGVVSAKLLELRSAPQLQLGNIRDIILMSALITAYVCASLIWHLKMASTAAAHDAMHGNGGRQGDLKAWLLITAIIDAAYFYFIFESLLNLIENYLAKHNQFTKLKIYRQVGAVAVAVFTFSLFGIIAHMVLPLKKYILEPHSWPLCFFVDNLYWNLLFLSATVSLLCILRPHKYSRLHLECEEIPTLLSTAGAQDTDVDTAAQSPAEENHHPFSAKLTDNSYHFMS